MPSEADIIAELETLKRELKALFREVSRLQVETEWVRHAPVMTGEGHKLGAEPKPYQDYGTVARAVR